MVPPESTDLAQQARMQKRSRASSSWAVILASVVLTASCCTTDAAAPAATGEILKRSLQKSEFTP